MSLYKFRVSPRDPSRIICNGKLAWRRLLATTSNVASDEVAKVAASSFAEVPVTEEVHRLVDKICSLDLIQTAQLAGLLKKRLNLPEVPMMGISMPGMGGGPSIGTVNGGSAAATVAASPAPEKSEFRVTLEKFDPANKAKVIKEIKALLPQLNLVEAKTFVESAPKLIKEKVKKDEAEKIKKTLEEFGAVVTLE